MYLSSTVLVTPALSSLSASLAALLTVVKLIRSANERQGLEGHGILPSLGYFLFLFICLSSCAASVHTQPQCLHTHGRLPSLQF